MARGRRRDSRMLAFRKLIDEELEQRVVAFDHSAAEAAAELMARQKAVGRLRDLRDTMIAGLALARRAALATRNVKHFADCGLEVLNPWELRRCRT
jgi:predicted nucleic acid-binding protein